jgi:hypothetical protein
VNSLLRFVIIYLGFLLITGGAFHLYNLNVDPRFTHSHGWLAFAVFALVTGLVHMFLLQAGKKDPKIFIRGFLAATTIKIFVYLGFLVVFVMSMRENAAVFIGEFAAFYFIFTVFEVSLLYRAVRPQK